MRLAVVAFMILVVCGCAATVYTVPDFAERTASHQTVAIIPFDVSIDLQELPDGMTQEDLRAQEQEEAYAFQRQIYTQFLQRYARGEYSVQFQDVDTTNALLNRADIGYDQMNSDYPKGELADLLSVDSTISGTITRNRPMGNWTALASTVLVGSGRTNEVNVSISLHDRTDSALLWNFDHEVGGGLGSSPEGLAESLMRGIAREFPYRGTN